MSSGSVILLCIIFCSKTKGIVVLSTYSLQNYPSKVIFYLLCGKTYLQM